jgi:capsular exopolysaccharide synthesis family protein
MSMPHGMAADGEAFGRFIQFLKKRSWLVVVGVLLGIASGMTTNMTAIKEYTAFSDIEIVPDNSGQFRLEQGQDMSSFSDDASRMDTEIEILQSRSLALETIEKLKLDRDNNFIPLEGGRPWDMSNPAVRADLIDTFLGSLNIARRGHTNILDISVTTRRPIMSALIANALVDRYIEHSYQDNYNDTTKISGWLNGELSTLKADLQKSQDQMIAYQKDLGIIGVDPKDSVFITSLEEMNKQLADVEVDRMLKEARLRALKSSTPDVIDAGAAMDPLLQVSKQQLAQLRAQYAAMSQTYGPAYPPLKTLKNQIELTERTRVQDEQAEVARAEKELEAAKDNENSLRNDLAAEEQNLFSKSDKAAQLELAQSQYQAKRLLYDGLQQRLQEAAIMAGLHSSNVRVVDEADIPLFPSKPRKHFNLAVGTFAGFVIGLALALVLESLDTNLKTMSDIERTLQLPLLAAIPSVETEDLLPSKFREFAVAKGTSSWSRIAEALRGMRTSILLSSAGAPPKVILITSTRPAEGKSSIATLMAITFALNGSRVLLIDADLRRPSVHLRFRIGKGLGLSSVLSGKSTYKEAVVSWPELPNLHLMTSGPVPPLPSELLGSKQMEDLLNELRADYDFILIDTPPVLAVTDAAILGRLSDATILIIRYGSAQRHVVQRCVDLLDRSGAHLLGVAVNVVDFSAPEYSEYYGRKYYEYYGERSPD